MKIYGNLIEACKAVEAMRVKNKANLPNRHIRLTDVCPGEKCNNGGEYGFYTHLEQVVRGIFLIYTTTTCDFDRCGTSGYPDPGEEQYVVLTNQQLDDMIAESNRIEAAGSLY